MADPNVWVTTGPNGEAVFNFRIPEGRSGPPGKTTVFVEDPDAPGVYTVQGPEGLFTEDPAAPGVYILEV